MKKTKILILIVAVAFGTLPCFDHANAFRGGGREGGGWSGGGRGGFGGEGRGEMPGQGGSGEYHGGGDHGDHGGHRHDNNNNNNNNNNNTTNNYYANGWGPGWDGWGYGAADDALAGMAMGTMIGAAAAQPSTIVVEQPATTVVQQAAPPMNAQVTVLPAGCMAQNVNGTMAYQCGSVWYRPFFGASGVYYQAVPPPPAPASGVPAQ